MINFKTEWRFYFFFKNTRKYVKLNTTNNNKRKSDFNIYA